jgi:hypothetical protein
MSKLATLLLIAVLVLSSLVMVGSVFAESIPKPSVPEFTLKFVDNSYDVPPTYEVNPYTGENVMTEEGYSAENKSIVITIKNQPFTHYYDNGTPIGLFYDVRFKGSFQEYWRQAYEAPNSFTPKYLNDDSLPEYTEISFPLENFAFAGEIPKSGEVNFQVQALIGYRTYYRESWYFMDAYDVTFTGESSGWSNTQTITIGEEQTPTPEPTSTPVATPELTSTPYQEPQQIEQDLIIIGMAIAVAVVGAGLGLLVYLIKRK